MKTGARTDVAMSIAKMLEVNTTLQALNLKQNSLGTEGMFLILDGMCPFLSSPPECKGYTHVKCCWDVVEAHESHEPHEPHKLHQLIEQACGRTRSWRSLRLTSA